MPKFHPLVVTDVHKTIRDAVVLTLAPETDEDFDFVQGQYLTCNFPSFFPAQIE